MDEGRTNCSRPWPRHLWIVRHGQSAGNVARDLAEAGGLPWIDIAERDIDVPLSNLGERQSTALGKWFGSREASQQPTIVLTSPYVRAISTARLLVAAANFEGTPGLLSDERLREKEFGILDRLTTVGIKERYPDLSEQRAHVGKFYFRPPGGESWCDVILRLRSVLDALGRDYAGQRVLIVAHQVIVNCFRFLIEQMDEAQILGIDRAADVPNCAVTEYEFDPCGPPLIRLLHFVAPLEDSGTLVTSAADVPAAHHP